MSLRQSKYLTNSLVALVAIAPTFRTLAQSTTFTYQGELKDTGVAVNGAHDLQFRLFDSLVGGVQVGTTQCSNNVVVTEGRFSVTLDFGQQFAVPLSRFMQIDVRADNGQPCTNTTGYVSLTPRQLITATPLANHAKSSFALDAADGSPANAMFVDNEGNIGIGTTTPGIDVAPSVKLEVAGGSISAGNSGDQADLLWLNSERNWVFRQQGAGAGAALKLQNVGGGGNKNFLIETTGLVGIGTLNPTHTLHIANASPTLAIQDTDSNGAPLGQQVGYVSFRDSGNVERAWIGYGSAGDPDLSVVNARTSGDIVLNTVGGGNVGIGTSSPAAKLDVRGDIKLGSSGQFFAVQSSSNDRVVRGQINANATIDAGRSSGGFTVTHTVTGTYVINFSAPFLSPPTCVAAGQAQCCTPKVTQTQTTFATVHVRNDAGTLTDAPFHFIVMGP